MFGLCVVGAVVLSFVLVGSLASRDEGFDWELASIFGTAVGTTLLALVTGWLGYLSQQDAAAREKPRVVVARVDHVEGQHPEPSVAQGRLVVALINAGLGPALRVHVEATYVGGEGASSDISTAPVPVVPPNLEPVPVTLSYSGQRGNKKQFSKTDFAIFGKFEDRSRKQKGRIEYLDSA
jgi:hypothetical protein